jgi:hypothetical protein
MAIKNFALTETQISQAELNIQHYVGLWKEWFVKNVDIDKASKEDLLVFRDFGIMLKLNERLAKYLRDMASNKGSAKAPAPKANDDLPAWLQKYRKDN